MIKKLKNTSFFLFIFCCLIYTLTNPAQCVFHTKNAIRMCAFSIIPTLYPSMIFSRMISHTSGGFYKNKPAKLLSEILGIPPVLVPVCLSGLICGAPSGAFAVCRIYDDGLCTEKEAQRACILSSNCSAMFILGYTADKLGSHLQGIIIYFASILSMLFVYMIFFRDDSKKTSEKPSFCKGQLTFSQVITESISSSAYTCVTLSGYIIFFYTFSRVFCQGLTEFLSGAFMSKSAAELSGILLSAVTEICSGVNAVSCLSGYKAGMICAFAVGFTGVCMIFQVVSILQKSRISSKRFILSKVLCSLVCPIFYTVALLIIPSSVQVFNSSDTSSGVTYSDVAVLIFITAVAFGGARLLSYLDKKHKK